MAYPFYPAPTLGDFLDRLTSEYNVQQKSLDMVVFGPEGMETVNYLERELPNGKTGRIYIPVDDPEERLTPDVVRSVCNRLGIPPEDFGLILG